MRAVPKLPAAILLATAIAAGASWFWQTAREAELRDELDQLSQPAISPDKNASPAQARAKPTADPDQIVDTLAASLVERTEALFEAKRSAGMYDEIEVQVADLSETDLFALMASDPGMNFVENLRDPKPPAPEWARNQVLWHAYKRLMEMAPQRGLALTKQSGLSPRSTSYLQNPVRAALSNWAKRDIDAAWGFLQQNAEQFSMSSRKPARLLASLAEDDVAAALAVGDRFGALADSMRYIAQSLRTRDDRTLFFEALAKLPDAEAKRGEYALKFADSILNSSGFARMRDFLETETPDVALPNATVLNLATKDFTSRPEEKADWLATVSEPRKLEQNITKFVDGWAVEDFNAVARWLRDHAAAPWRDVAVAAFAKKIHSLDPEGADQWASTIAEDSARQRLVDQLEDGNPGLNSVR